MKKIIALFLFVIFFFSCSSNDNNANPDNPSITSNIKLKKITSGNSITNFEYTDGLLSKVTSATPTQTSDVFEYKYENGKIKQRIFYQVTVAGATINQSYQNFYYTGGKISTDSGNDYSYIFSNSYSYTNDLLLNRKQFNENGVLNNNYDFEYYSDGNVKKQTETSNTGVYVSTFDSYDNKNNYEKLLYTPELQLLNRTSKNNLLASKIVNTNYTYEYEYNSDNFPTKITKKKNGTVQSVKFLEY